MPGFALRPPSLVLCGLLAGAVPAWATSVDGTLQLRLDRRHDAFLKSRPAGAPAIGITNPVATLQGDSYPLFIVADRMDGRTDDVAHAEGKVELRKVDAQVFGDKVTYWPLDDEVEAEGDVRILQEGQDVRAPYMRMKLSEQVGVAEQVDFLFVREVQSNFYKRRQSLVKPTSAATNSAVTGAPMMMHVSPAYGLPTKFEGTRPALSSGYAERAEFEGENQVRLFDNTFSTCKPGERDWYIKSSEMFLDFDEEAGEARNATLYFQDVPIGHTPFLTFPLNSGRRSGFFQPSFGVSTRDGLEVFTPYYWNIAPNYDLTLYPRFMSDRGLLLGTEARYLSQNVPLHRTRLEYMPDDKLYGGDRYSYDIKHNQVLGRGASVVVNWMGVSDPLYYQETSSRIAETSQTQLPRQIMLNYTPTSWLTSILNYQRFQTLQTDPQNPIRPPYFLEPQFSFAAIKPNVYNMDLALIGQYSRFTHALPLPSQPVGDRFVLYPQLSVPFVHPAFSITPKVGFHGTQYSLDYTSDPLLGQQSLTRTLPVATLDTAVFFERETELLGKNFIQTLEPRVYYVKIPYRNQSNYPVFDTGLTDFNFAQIFSENRYAGYDRINDANQMTTALTTRVLSAETGVELFKAMVGQRRYFSDSKVFLPGETPPTKGASNIVVAANGLVAPKTYAEAAWEYDYDANVAQRYSVGVRYQPELGKVISAGYRYTRDPVSEIPQVDQIDIAGQWPLSGRFSIVGRYNYSFRDYYVSSSGNGPAVRESGQLLEAIAGIEYTAGCWALRIVGQRLEALATEPNTTVFVQLELTDFASIGSNPLSLLRRSVPGYGKINELPEYGGGLMMTQ
jgi:LPS-assembly protein